MAKDLLFTLAVNTASFEASTKRAANSIGELQKTISSIQASAFVYLGEQAIIAGEKLYNFTRRIAETGEEIARMSEISGLSTRKWQEWSGAAYLANISQDSLARGLKFLSRAIKDSGDMGTDAGKAFSAMGISVNDVSGRTKSLDQVMGEVADKFSGWEDGPRKIAISLALFGRSGQDMIPILNKGRSGIQELQGELNRLGVILGADTIKRLEESEKRFREMDLVIKAMRTNLTPLVDLFSALGLTVLETFNKISNWFKSHPEILRLFTYTIPGLAGIVPSQGKIAEAELYKYPQYEAPPGVKKEAPKLINPDNPFDIPGFSLRRTTEELNKLKAQAAGTSPFGVGWGAEGDIGIKKGEMAIEGMVITIKDYETSLKALDDAYMKTIDIQEIAGPIQHQTNAITERSILLENERNQSILDLTKQYADLTDNLQLSISVDKGMEDEYIRVNNLTVQQIELVRALGMERRNQLANKEIVDAATDVARSMSSAWSSGLMDMINRTKSFADAMKGIITDMGNIIIKKLLEISMNYALMGNITGQKVTGGVFGGIGNLFSRLLGGGGVPATGYGGAGIGGTIGFGSSLQTGGVVSRPSFHLIGESGPEVVIPLKGGKVPVEGGKGDTYNTFIQATDLGSFTRLYGPTIESIYFKGKRFNKVAMRG